MGKDPAFLFYPGDWLGGTMTFTRHHKGAYMDLLMAQFNSGHLSLDQINTVLGEKDENLWITVLKSKFKEDVNGLFYNEKLEKEIIKRKKWTESREENLRKNKSHMETHTDSHMDAHMENENDNEDINKEKIRKVFKQPTLEEVTQYCHERKNNVNPRLFIDHYTSNGWKVGKNSMKDWKAAVRTWENNDLKTPTQKTKKPESPYEQCPRCGRELRKGYEYIKIGGQMCCEYCPEAREQAKVSYGKLMGMNGIKSVG